MIFAFQQNMDFWTFLPFKQIRTAFTWALYLNVFIILYDYQFWFSLFSLLLWLIITVIIIIIFVILIYTFVYIEYFWILNIWRSRTLFNIGNKDTEIISVSLLWNLINVCQIYFSVNLLLKWHYYILSLIIISFIL